VGITLWGIDKATIQEAGVAGSVKRAVLRVLNGTVTADDISIVDVAQKDAADVPSTRAQRVRPSFVPKPSITSRPQPTKGGDDKPSITPRPQPTKGGEDKPSSTSHPQPTKGGDDKPSITSRPNGGDTSEDKPRQDDTDDKGTDRPVTELARDLQADEEGSFEDGLVFEGATIITVYVNVDEGEKDTIMRSVEDAVKSGQMSDLVVEETQASLPLLAVGISGGEVAVESNDLAQLEVATPESLAADEPKEGKSSSSSTNATLSSGASAGVAVAAIALVAMAVAAIVLSRRRKAAAASGGLARTVAGDADSQVDIQNPLGHGAKQDAAQSSV
jgi:hypothetical protein